MLMTAFGGIPSLEIQAMNARRGAEQQGRGQVGAWAVTRIGNSYDIELSPCRICRLGADF